MSFTIIDHNHGFFTLTWVLQSLQSIALPPELRWGQSECLTLTKAAMACGPAEFTIHFPHKGTVHQGCPQHSQIYLGISFLGWVCFVDTLKSRLMGPPSAVGQQDKQPQDLVGVRVAAISCIIHSPQMSEGNGRVLGQQKSPLTKLWKEISRFQRTKNGSNAPFLFVPLPVSMTGTDISLCCLSLAAGWGFIDGDAGCKDIFLCCPWCQKM